MRKVKDPSKNSTPADLALIKLQLVSGALSKRCNPFIHSLVLNHSTRTMVALAPAHPLPEPSAVLTSALIRQGILASTLASQPRHTFPQHSLCCTAPCLRIRCFSKGSFLLYLP